MSSWVFKVKYSRSSQGMTPWELFIFLPFSWNLLISFAVSLRIALYSSSFRSFNGSFPIKGEVLTLCSFPYSPLYWIQGVRDNCIATPWIWTVFCATPDNYSMKGSLALGSKKSWRSEFCCIQERFVSEVSC